jgi:hypothetical protein
MSCNTSQCLIKVAAKGGLTVYKENDKNDVNCTN